MTNLLEETLSVLTDNGKSPADVEWVGSPGYGWASWEEFAKVADKEYDAGYGAQKVAEDLLVVGDDWWLSRHEYDGAESWEFNQKPEWPSRAVWLNRVVITDDDEDFVGWRSLEELND